MSCRENFNVVICANFFILGNLQGGCHFCIGDLYPVAIQCILDWIVSKKTRSGWCGTRGELGKEAR